MATMGFATQSTPFKPSSLRRQPYFWFCHCCPHSFSTSRSFWAASSKALCRLEDGKTLATYFPISSRTAIGDSFGKISVRSKVHASVRGCSNATYKSWGDMTQDIRKTKEEYRNELAHSLRILPDGSCYSFRQQSATTDLSYPSTSIPPRFKKINDSTSSSMHNKFNVEAESRITPDHEINDKLSSIRLPGASKRQEMTLEKHWNISPRTTQIHLKPSQVNSSSPSVFVEQEETSSMNEDICPYVVERDAAAAKKSICVDVVNGTRIEKYSGESDEMVRSNLYENLFYIYDNVLVVDCVSAAKAVVSMLTNEYRHFVHACDTEVSKIDVKLETPVDHGEIICFSIYSGPEANFGNGKSCIWVDVLDGGGKHILAEFAPFFEDPSIKKVWHNYSFDNHVIENYGIKLAGFHADTMHMARLWNSSRRLEGGYSLEALTGDSKIMSDAKLLPGEELISKVSMKTIFGRKKVKKDGSEGKVITVPSVEELQTAERMPWICYSALDSISTYKLYESLESKLSKLEWKLDGSTRGSMFKFYRQYWHPFGELLVKMEAEGMLVDRVYLSEIEKVAKAEQQIAVKRFRSWAAKYCRDAYYMNVGSDAQLRQLFFGGIQNKKNADETLPIKREFKVPNIDKVIEKGKKAPTKFRTITLHRIFDEPLKPDLYTASGWPSVSVDALKALAGSVSDEFDVMAEDGQLQSDDSSRVADSEESDLMDKSACSANGVEQRIEAKLAISALCEVCSIDSLISNFILPLQGNHISGKNGRIHCSLNINTETGRLSARRPNLQNQPALEKDRYKIRQAFIAAPGNSLIVADYGQLELRILAHLAKCKSMLNAFKAGGDFHSRTAMNMYPHIREAIEKKKVLLEWHPQPGEEKPPVPLLKDAFASERRKAKMLNFSIAYGKTAMGLARDWKVSVEEARNTVDLWYSDRKEVLKWQEERKAEARINRRVHTLLGRARQFPSQKNATSSQKGHIDRAAINTPVQGSAADVAMCAMLEISKNAQLKELGWRLLLQIHDEVILEGPTESADIAKAIVVECMSKPFDGKNILKVGLSVDAKCAQSWYAAK